MGVCGLWLTAQPSQNKKRKVKRRRGEERETEERKTVCNCSRGDDLDTGEGIPINAIPQLTKQDEKRNPNQQTPRHLIDTSSRFSCHHLVFMLLVCVLHPFRLPLLPISLPAPRHALLTPSHSPAVWADRLPIVVVGAVDAMYPLERVNHGPMMGRSSLFAYLPRDIVWVRIQSAQVSHLLTLTD